MQSIYFSHAAVNPNPQNHYSPASVTDIVQVLASIILCR